MAGRGRGFIYYVSVTGVTGARQALDNRLRAQVARVRRATSLPVGVGFGISTPKQAAWIAGFADAAVVGSALSKESKRQREYGESPVRRAFVSELKRAMKQVAKAELGQFLRSRAYQLGSGPFNLSPWMRIRKLSTRSTTCAAGDRSPPGSHEPGFSSL